jgi:Leucine-rich repeat (LRR) protein
VRIKDIEPEDAAVFAAVDSLSLELDWTAGDNAAASAAPVPPSPTTSGAPGSVTYAPSVGPNGVTYAPATPQPAIGKPAKKPKTGKLQNDFTRLFDGMGESPRLKELKISSPFDDLFDPQSFQFLEKLKFLEAISVQNVGADDRAAETLAKLPKLERLRLYGQAISDKSVEKLAQSSTIQFLDLSETSITDDCIDSLLKMKQLKELHAYRTKITKEKAKALEEKGVIVKAFQDCNCLNWERYSPTHGGMGI